MKLRDYQQDAVDHVLAKLPEYKRVLLVACTGFGKTPCSAYLIEYFRDRNQSSMLIAHRQELISQASMTLCHFGISHQLICPKPLIQKIKMMHFEEFGESFVDPFSMVSLGSAQTVVRRLDKLTRPDLLIVDEAAHAVSNLWKKTIDYFDTLTVGVTATPTRSDRRSLGEVFNYMHVGKDMSSVIRNGSLCRYTIYSTPEEFDLSNVKRIQSGENKGDYNRKDLAEQIDKPKIVGRAVEHYEKFTKGKRAMVFAVSVKHSEHIAEEFRNAGYRFVSIDGTTDDRIRYKAFQDLKKNEIDGIVNVDIAGEGVSVDGVEVVIMLRPISEMAFGLYAQQIGRALRLAPGKEKGIVIDMCQNASRHGFVEDKTDWTLWEGEEKKKRGKQDESDVKVKTCPDCFFTHKPSPMCPDCGYVYPVAVGREYEQVDGDLVEIQRKQEAEQRRVDQNALLRQAQSTAEMAAIDAKLGMKRGATAHKARAIEEKRQAMATLRKAMKHYRENVAWGNPVAFDAILQRAFGYSEKEAMKLGATRANRLIDQMRELAALRNSEADSTYSPINYRYYLAALSEGKQLEF